MDIVSALAGAMTAVLGLIAMALSLHSRFRKWLKGIVRDVLTETGVVRYIHPDEDVRQFWQMWPGGHKNLPDSLAGIYDRIGDLEEYHNGG